MSKTSNKKKDVSPVLARVSLVCMLGTCLFLAPGDSDANGFHIIVMHDDMANVIVDVDMSLMPETTPVNNPGDSGGGDTGGGDTGGGDTGGGDTGGGDTGDTGGSGKSNNGHGNNEDGVDSSNPSQGKGGPNGAEDPSCGAGGCVDDESKGGGASPSKNKNQNQNQSQGAGQNQNSSSSSSGSGKDKKK